MGPAVVLPIFWTGFGIGTVAIGSRVASGLIAQDNYVPYKVESVDRSDKVIQIRVRSCWLGHGLGSSIGSVLSGMTTGNSLTHWWIEIQTQKGWYCAQLNKGGVYLHKHQSLSAVNNCGLYQGGNDNNGNITTKKTFRPSNRNMGQVYDYVSNSNNHYDLVNHNCQDWAQQFYRWIR